MSEVFGTDCLLLPVHGLAASPDGRAASLALRIEIGSSALGETTVENRQTESEGVRQDEQRLVELLLQVAQDLGRSRAVEEKDWEGMVERQRLGERSLESRVRMTGPV